MYEERGAGKPETFDFLSFTNYCGKSRNGKFRVKRRTSKEKFYNSCKRCTEWIKNNRILPKRDLMRQLTVKLVVYYNYYGVTDNYPWIYKFYRAIIMALKVWLNRRGRKGNLTWSKLSKLLQQYPLPKPRICVNFSD